MDLQRIGTRHVHQDVGSVGELQLVGHIDVALLVGQSSEVVIARHTLLKDIQRLLVLARASSPDRMSVKMLRMLRLRFIKICNSAECFKS